MATMDGHITGFDSRFWDGRLDDPRDFDFAYIKLTDGIWGDKESTLAKVQYDSAGFKGMKRGFFHFWRFATPAKPQAQWFAYRLLRYAEELPPGLDFEDKAAPCGQICADAIDEFIWEFTNILPAESLIYTATWWWNQHVGGSRFSKTNPYELPLWEADPPPNTIFPGKWKDYAVIQHDLDIRVPGMNAAVDIDYARLDWWNKYVEPPPFWEDMDVHQRVAAMGELAKMHGLAR